MILEREVAKIWERDADELRRHANALRARANRKEAESVAGLSLDQAALKIITARSEPPTYIALFHVLKHGQAAHLNVVQFYYAMRRSGTVRMNGAHVVRRRETNQSLIEPKDVKK